MESRRFGALERLRSGPAGAVVLVVSCLVLVLLAGQMLFGSGEIGLGVDDYVHALRFDQWLDSGWYVPEYLLSAGEPDPSRIEATPFVYGAAFNVLAHLLNAVLGIESIGEISTEADAYAVRHLTTALIGLATVLCVGGTVWTLTRDRLAAVWGAAALLAIPVWTGYAMFSNKDVPVAAAFTFVTFGLVLLLSWADRRPARFAAAATSAAALVAFGVFLGVGTRPAIWVPLLASLVTFALLSWRSLGSIRAAARAVAPPALAFILGLAGAVMLHPRTAGDPVEWLLKSVSESSEAGREGVITLTAGQALGEFPPIWYLPAWTFAAVPVLVFLIATAGAAVVVGNTLSRSRREASPQSRLSLTGGALLVVLQLVLLPTAAIVTGSAMSTGLRQHLYVLPAIAILAGVGAASLLRAREPAGASPRRVGWIAAAALCLALAVPAVEQTRLYPYNYVYVNPIAGLGGVEGRWETEYQFISAREAFGRVPAGVEPACASWLSRPGSVVEDSVIEPCSALAAPYPDEVGDDAVTSAPRGEVWVVARMRGRGRPPPACEERDNVTRMLRGERLVMAYVLSCDFAPRSPESRVIAELERE